MGISGNSFLARIYVGGYDAFGYLERSPSGDFQYYDLVEQYADFLDGDLFADIWRMTLHDGVVYFVGLEHLFRFDTETGEARAWRHEGSFGPITTFQERVYLQFRGEGIKVFDGDKWQLIPGPDTSRIFLTALTQVTPDRLIAVSPE